MPLVDRRSDNVVLRIVFDGLPEAGKTTNVQQLCEKISLNRRGMLRAPGTTGARTEFFDWLDVSGGYLGGRRIRCQLVTVPGQPELLRRRRYLLRSADAVVFVADSRVEHVESNLVLVGQLRRLLGEQASNAVRLVLQANKQDLQGALPAVELARALGLPEGTPCIPGQAAVGIGVLETFMLAVRVAVDRVREIVAAGELIAGDAQEDQELYQEMTRAERAGEATGLDQVLQAVEEVSARARNTPAPPTQVLPPASNEEEPCLPRSDVPPGLVWPPSTGRAVLRRLEAATPEPERPSWDQGMIGRRCGSLIAVSRPEACYQNLELARRALLAQVSDFVALEDLRPPDRTVAVAVQDSTGWRVWTISASMPTALDHLRSACADGGRSLGEAVVRVLEALAHVASVEARRGISLRPSLRAIGIDAELTCYLGPVGGARAHEPPDPSQILSTELRPLLAEDPRLQPELIAYLRGLGPTDSRRAEAVAVADALGSEGIVAPVEAAPVEPEAAAPRPDDEGLSSVDEVELAYDAVPVEPQAEPHVEPHVEPQVEPEPEPEPAPPSFPRMDLPAGLVWPPMQGRLALVALGAGTARRSPAPRRWAPVDAVEFELPESWLAHTRPAWQFADLDEGRVALMDLVRRQTRLVQVMPRGRAIALAPDDDVHRIWIVTQDPGSVASGLRAAIASGATGRVAEELLAGVVAVLELASLIGPEAETLDLEQISLSDETPRYLGLVLPAAAADGIERPSLSDRLRAQLDELLADVPALRGELAEALSKKAMRREWTDDQRQVLEGMGVMG